MKSAVKAVVREPLFHFLLLAAALFVVGSLFTRSDDVIEVSREEIEWRILQVEAGRGTRLTDDERRLVEQQYIDERVLVREAQTMGLSADERIDDILVQKMLHVLSGVMWIGLLWYFNFVQIPNMPNIEASQRPAILQTKTP